MANEVYELRANFFSGGEPCTCVFHYFIDNVVPTHPYTLAGQLINALDDGAPGTEWLTKLQACMSEDAFVSYLSAKRVTDPGGQGFVSRQAPADFPGTVANPIHTQQVCGTIIWISTTEPENTGRNFLPAVPETFLDGSRWEAAAYTAYDEFIAKHLTGHSVAAGLFMPCIFDRVAKTFRAIINGYLSPIPGTQRGREKPL